MVSDINETNKTKKSNPNDLHKTAVICYDFIAGYFGQLCLIGVIFMVVRIAFHGWSNVWWNFDEITTKITDQHYTNDIDYRTYSIFECQSQYGNWN